MHRDTKIWIKVGTSLIDYNQIESILKDVNGNAQIMMKSGNPLFTNYSHDLVIKEIGEVISYYGDARCELELVKENKND